MFFFSFDIAVQEKDLIPLEPLDPLPPTPKAQLDVVNNVLDSLYEEKVSIDIFLNKKKYF